MHKLRSLLASLALAVSAFFPYVRRGAIQRADALLGGVGSGQRASFNSRKTSPRKGGIAMKYEFVPWTSYADRFINELNSHGKLCDLIIGDSQWIGGSAENGHYVKLNDFFDKNHISMSTFMPATVLGYAEWPQTHAELLGVTGDGRRCRLDLSQRLVRETRVARRISEEIRSVARAAENVGPAQRYRAVLSRPHGRR